MVTNGWQCEEGHEPEGRQGGLEGAARRPDVEGVQDRRGLSTLAEAEEAVAAASEGREGVAPATPSLSSDPILPHA